MNAPASPTNLDNLDQIFVAAFQSLYKTLTECERRDREKAQEGVAKIKSRESLLERCTGGSDEVRKFLEAGERVIRDMWSQYTLLTGNYTERLRRHQYVPRTLKEVSEGVWDEVSRSLEPIKRDISSRMQQNHWKGRGADDYMKQLPMQLNAVTEYGQYVEAANTGVIVPAELQALVFAAGGTAITRRTLMIQQTMYAQGAPNTYFTASAAAARELRAVNTWWTTKLMTGQGSWRITIDNHIREMTSSRVRNPVVLTGDKWPRATKDTKDFPTPGTTPIVDQQSGSNVRGPDPSSGGPAGGVNQGDYHKEDKGGRIW